jgi:Spy/CpxP family protein refolding chaperone
MKSIRIALLGAALVAGVATVGSAQAAQTQPAQKAGQHQHRGGKHAARAGHGRKALLRGIKLTDAEKAQLKTVHAKYRTQLQSLRESMKPQLEAARAARQKGDSAAAKAAWARTADARAKAKALREQELAEVRGALTPEHRQTFDQNVQRLKERQATREARRQQRQGRKAPGA